MFFDKVKLELPNGGYEFVMERGLEYNVMNGHFRSRISPTTRKRWSCTGFAT